MLGARRITWIEENPELGKWAIVRFTADHSPDGPEYVMNGHDYKVYLAEKALTDAIDSFPFAQVLKDGLERLIEEYGEKMRELGQWDEVSRNID